MPFLTRDTILSPSRVRASDLWAPTPGVRLAAECHDLAERCRAILLALPAGSAASHGSAGRLLGFPLPRRLEHRLDVIVPADARIRRAGIITHRHTLHSGDIVVVDGIPVTRPERTFCDLAELLTVVELTIVGDHLAHRMPVQALHRAHASHRARRGRLTRRAALEAIDPRSESPKETELRLILDEAGIGPFAANHEIRDEHGVLIARVDLALVTRRIAVEYEGDHHRERDQWRRDITRRRRIEASGWVYIPVTQSDLDHRHAMLHDLRRAIASRPIR